MNAESLDEQSPEQWTCFHKFQNVLNIDDIRDIKMIETFYGKIYFVVNEKHVLTKNRFMMSENKRYLSNTEKGEGAHMNWAHSDLMKEDE